eukprot:TRINITY_DN29518_c0_g1_i1.p1 TRINITY_DN29518_c0_g1~~TRINITY_DN29518_c0_g1_i1.p1  ORF type:complete len:620 (+),score=211.26 TRINITY_DN29518_c0_g1_i1:68-1861(+)
MVPKKHKSKRTSLRQKYKVIRKVNEHRRKLVRLKKKNPHLAKKKEKDPGIPNTWPHKEELLMEIDNTREAMVAAKELQKKARQDAIEKKRRANLVLQNRGKTLAQFTSEAAARQEKYDTDQMNEGGDDGERERVIMGQGIAESRTYYREFRKVVDLADVILEVLDARDPLGCRCREIEQRIMRLDPSKRIILVLNKIDLVPQDVAVKWLKYLRNELPTVAFKASTQTQRKNIGSRKGGATKQNVNLKTSEALGADTLVQLLKNYSRNQKLKTSICVGIIGYPNVGKSSIINSLKRSKAANVGSTPGLTKSVQEVMLDKKVRLLDSPGIVFSNAGSENDADAILRNSIKVDKIVDPVLPVSSILKRCDPEYLMSLYSIPAFPKGVDEFLLHVAQRTGRLKKGGIPDLESAARKVLQDWNGGVVKYFTMPPEERPDMHLSASIVTDWSKEFNIDDVIPDAGSLVTRLQSDEDNSAAAGFMQIEAGPTVAEDQGFLEDPPPPKPKGSNRAASAAGRARKAEQLAMQQGGDDDDEMDDSDDQLRAAIDEDEVGNALSAKARKKAAKKAKKDTRRGRTNKSDAYDFTEGWDSDDNGDMEDSD